MQKSSLQWSECLNRDYSPSFPTPEPVFFLPPLAACPPHLSPASCPSARSGLCWALGRPSDKPRTTSSLLTDTWYYAGVGKWHMDTTRGPGLENLTVSSVWPQRIWYLGRYWGPMWRYWLRNSREIGRFTWTSQPHVPNGTCSFTESSGHWDEHNDL